ncbi:hypothetical protein BS78_02G153700 [Paspalum vaginatum]|nr:hypothetical protein BS78_02G153700 [Paspalum vaginatum]
MLRSFSSCKLSRDLLVHDSCHGLPGFICYFNLTWHNPDYDRQVNWSASSYHSERRKKLGTQKLQKTWLQCRQRGASNNETNCAEPVHEAA